MITIMQRLKKLIKHKNFKRIALAFAVAIAITTIYVIVSILFPPDYIKKEKIITSISTETPIYYMDGENRLGVFFASEHRRYIDIENIPKLFKDAIVAAEDKNFYKHWGIDFIALGRAIIKNIAAMRVVQGGSTITLQTAENLFKTNRSFRGKFREFLEAMRLEYHYTKDEILEFYINQFFVNSNGRGLAIASEYFFNKKIHELDLIECAFIAGAVQAPYRFNPYSKKDPEKREAAYERAMKRKNYVITNMHKLKMITDEQYEESISAPIKFNIGKFAYKSNVIWDMVRDELLSSGFADIFSEEGIENLGTSGLKIYTSIDKNIHEATLYALRRQLSKLDIILSGYQKIDEVKGDLKLYKCSEILNKGDFCVAKIEKEKINIKDLKKLEIPVDISPSMFGIIDYKGASRIAHFIAKRKRGIWAGANKNEITEFIKWLKNLDYVLVSIRYIDKEKNRAYLDIEQYPRINGGVIALEKGNIRAVVGGFDNKDYNRAIHAKRQPGSIFKILVYAAALQLGWNTLDPLNNTRNVFPYYNELYFPKPDHWPAPPEVSLEWAGVKSENLATVYLLYNLFDKLSLNQFKKVLRKLKLDPDSYNSDADFLTDLRDKIGISLISGKFKSHIFEKVKQELITDLVFSESYEQALNLKNVHYGLYFDDALEKLIEEIKEQKKQLLKEKDLLEYRKIKKDIEENKLRIRLLSKGFLRIKKIVSKFNEDWGKLVGNLGLAKKQKILNHFYIKEDNKDRSILSYIPEPEFKDIKNLTPLTITKFNEIILGNLDVEKDILINGEFNISLINKLNQKLETKFAQIKPNIGYNSDSLYFHPDFRVYASLKYVANLSYELGIATKLDEVLSFPLGSNSVSQIEIAKTFGGLSTGIKHYYPFSGTTYGTSLIEKIVDAEGTVIYEKKPVSKKVFKKKISWMLNDILYNVTNHGTGQALRNSVYLRSNNPKADRELRSYNIKVPTFGKTGTANDFTNASFVGIIPFYQETSDKLSMQDTYVIASYVGYDTNEKLESPPIKIAGASGALPIFRDVANAIIKTKEYYKNTDIGEIAFASKNVLPVERVHDMINVSINKYSGLQIYEDPEKEPIRIYSLGKFEDGKFVPKRLFELYYE